MSYFIFIYLTIIRNYKKCENKKYVYLLEGEKKEGFSSSIMKKESAGI